MITPRVIDPRSTANATLAVTDHTDLLVIGAGPAGLAAAITGAGRGLSVVLVDENPVPAATMGDDVPLHFGQRMSGAVRNRTAMTEALLTNRPALADAMEAGVDVRLGTIVWGLYANGPSVGWLPGMVAGVSDGERSFMLGFKAVIVASGRRDMGLAFPGWHIPGVMGATAAERLASTYGALEARRAIVLGSSAEALLAARAMLQAGVDVAAIVEQAAAPVSPAALVAELQGAGRHSPPHPARDRRGRGRPRRRHRRPPLASTGRSRPTPPRRDSRSRATPSCSASPHDPGRSSCWTRSAVAAPSCPSAAATCRSPTPCTAP